MSSYRSSGTHSHEGGGGGGGVASALGRSNSLNSSTLPNYSSTRVSTRVFENRMTKRREDQALHDQLSNYNAVNSRLLGTNLSDERVETLRRLKKFQTQNGELATIYKHEAQEREKQQRKLLAQQDEVLASALAQIKNEKFAEETTNKRICDDSAELQELVQLLKAAEINKIRHEQLIEKEEIEKNEKNRERALDQAMEADRQQALAIKRAEEERKFAMNQAGKAVLTEQMAERKMLKQLAYEAFLKEKATVDEVVKGIALDDETKRNKLLARRRELQDNIRIFLEERSAWRAAEKQRAENELQKIHEYQQQQQERQKEIELAKKKKSDQKDMVLAKLTAEIQAKKKEEEEMQSLLYELYQEEAEQKALNELKEREEKLIRMRTEMIQANEYQKAVKQQRALQAQNEEAEFRAAMMLKFSEDSRLEQLNAERRRREMAEYKREVERLIADRRAAYEKAVENELAQRRKEQEEVEYKLAVVEKERAALLDKYAPALKEWLPKGVLRTEAEYERLFGTKPPSSSSFKGEEPPSMSLTNTINPINEREAQKEKEKERQLHNHINNQNYNNRFRR